MAGEIVKWTDVFGNQNVFMSGNGDDVFHSIPEHKDEEGTFHVVILSKKAMIEFLEQCGYTITKAEEKQKC